MVNLHLADAADPKAQDMFINQIAVGLDVLARTAFALAALRTASGEEEPTTVQILDAVDYLAEKAKEGVRDGLIQSLRNDHAELLRRKLGEEKIS